ncbi:MAG: hypothetical protein HY252_09800 [Sphingobacteriales bacterium]|nr:hypothetical protein [Sphingobacteriales bacterium]
MNELLNNILKKRTYSTIDKKEIRIHSETGEEQCLLLQNIILKNNFSSSLEIGCAYGISSLAITEAVAKNNGKHTIIDKFENSDWGG